MSAAQSQPSDASSVFDRLGIAEAPLTDNDPVSFLRSLAAASTALAKNPSEGLAASNRLAIGLAAAVRASAGLMLGQGPVGPVAPAKGDKRFDDPAYAANPLYFLLEQQYLLAAQLV